MRGDDDSTSTVAALGRSRSRRQVADLWVRRAGIACLVAVLGFAGAGTFGHRSTTLRAGGPDVQLEVTASTRTRSGLPVQLRVDVRGIRGELPPAVEVRVPVAWLDLVDQHAVSPSPADEWLDGRDVVWTFRPAPREGELTVLLDARWEVDAWGSHPGHVGVAAPGRSEVRVGWTTWIWP